MTILYLDVDYILMQIKAASVQCDCKCSKQLKQVHDSNLSTYSCTCGPDTIFDFRLSSRVGPDWPISAIGETWMYMLEYAVTHCCRYGAYLQNLCETQRWWVVGSMTLHESTDLMQLLCKADNIGFLLSITTH